VGELATSIAVMYAGRVVEVGPAEQVLTHPSHPYTQGLLSSTPDHRVAALVQPMPGVAPSLADRTTNACAFAPRCSRATDECRASAPQLRAMAGKDTAARCFHPVDEPFSVVHRQLPARERGRDEVLAAKNLGVVYTVRGEKVAAVNDVTFSLAKGECLALVGESGSGKTTIARAVAGLQRYTGEVVVHGEPLACLAAQRSAEQRRLVQIVFQNPTLALNPREEVRRAITRSLAICPRESRRTVEELLELVRLPVSLADSLPQELSGGERQRVSIARALACDPQVVICDEITSALDVSVQAAILTLLRGLREELGVSLLFITHDLGVVANLASEVLVLQRGVVCETGSARQVLDAPTATYTQDLMKAAPSLNAAAAPTAS
jgi:peptide/nickel transport system ATP-binding protein